MFISWRGIEGLCMKCRFLGGQARSHYVTAGMPSARQELSQARVIYSIYVNKPELYP